MSTIEWCGLKTVPVYPFRSIRSIHRSDGEAPKRVSNRSIREAVDLLFPLPLEGWRIGVLRHLRAVIVFPVDPPADLRGTPIPAFVLDRIYRSPRLLSKTIGTGRRTIVLETAYGFDRYDLSPIGLIRCSSGVTPPPAPPIWAPPSIRNRERLRALPKSRSPSLRIGDGIAIGASILALLVSLLPSTADTDYQSIDNPAYPQSPGRSIVDHASGEVAAFLIDRYPDSRIVAVERRGERVSIVFEVPVGGITEIDEQRWRSSVPSSVESIQIERNKRLATIEILWRSQ